MRAVAYEYGTYSYNTPKDTSPDHVAQHELALGMQYLGGRLIDSRRTVGGRRSYTPKSNNDIGAWFYPINTLNRLVYAVRGGMEDWAYMGSWDEASKTFSCYPKGSNEKHGYPNYDRNKTIYHDSMLRSFNFLIETSDLKIPKDKWGNIENSIDLWDINGVSSNLKDIQIIKDESQTVKNSLNDGHISRNMRITLFAIDMVQPYVKPLLYSPNIVFNFDENNSKQNNNSSTVSNCDFNCIYWIVSGVTSVQRYEILASPLESDNWVTIESSNDRKNLNILDMMTEYNSIVKNGESQEAKFDFSNIVDDEQKTFNSESMFNDEMYGKWAIGNKYNFYKFGIHFKYEFRADTIKSKVLPLCNSDNNNNNRGCSIELQIRVKCDDQWFDNIEILSEKNKKFESFPNDIVAQSHIVNARNNIEWKSRNGKYFVKSQLWWMLDKPLQLNIVDALSIKSRNEISIKLGEYGNVFPSNNNGNKANGSDNSIGNDNGNNINVEDSKDNKGISNEKLAVLPTNGSLTNTEKNGILETFSEQLLLFIICAAAIVGLLFWRKRSKKRSDNTEYKALVNQNDGNNSGLIQITTDGSSSPSSRKSVPIKSSLQGDLKSRAWLMSRP